jgi:hypothetical protein|tara:strand:+ start:286 stop:501 length:216 start_codon:yes stop_codon:yes gene_type:complete
MRDSFHSLRSGRPPKKADESLDYVGMSFRVSPKLKNLLMEIADGYGITITELLLMMTLKEAGIETLDETKI